MSKLNKEELLDSLEKTIGHANSSMPMDWTDEDGDAVEQIKELIQKPQHDEKTERKLQEIYSDKKPEVTESWIEEKARELHEMCSYADRTHGFMYTISIDSAKDFIRSLVELVLHLKNKD